MKQNSLVSLIVLLIGMVLTACSSQAQPTPTATLGPTNITQPTTTASEGKPLNSSFIAVYVPKPNETATTSIWDQKQVSCDGKPLNMWGTTGTYIYKSNNRAFSTLTLKSGEVFPNNNIGVYGPIPLSPAGTMTLSTSLGTFQATVLSAESAYDITTGRLDTVKGTYQRVEYYICGYGLIKLISSDSGLKEPGDYSYSSREDLDLLSFTPLTTNESHVRYILADMQLGNVVGGYRADVADEETAEALRRWDAGIRVVNIEEFERRVVDGHWQIVYADTNNSITGMDVRLTSDLPQ